MSSISSTDQNRHESWPRCLCNRISARLFAGTEWSRGPDTLDEALFKFNMQFDLAQDTALPDESKDVLPRPRSSVTTTRPTAELAHTIVYDPDMDDRADPDEVVWISLQLGGENAALREYAMVAVGRHDQYLLGMLISTRSEHSEQPERLFTGSGFWNEDPKPSWVHMDRTLLTPESGIRHAGAMMSRRRFELIAARLHGDYGWN